MPTAHVDPYRRVRGGTFGWRLRLDADDSVIADDAGRHFESYADALSFGSSVLAGDFSRDDIAPSLDVDSGGG